ncbi:interleukin-6 receptor subunit beta-like isoform X2 [Mustelus asterias]
MLSMENTISAWAWVIFSISACVAEGKLSRLCHDVGLTKVFKLQSSASLSCALREDCLKSLGANASHIFWKMNDTQIPQQQYDFNTTVSRVTFQVVKGYLTCHINMKGVTNILHRFTIEAGLPPDKPKDISCISHWRKSFTCFWDQGRETFIETNFTLIRIQNQWKNDTCVTLKNTCSFMFPRIHISENLRLIVMAQNALGKAQSDPLVLNTWHTWKTNPPQKVIVHSILGQSRSLLVTWHKPTEKPPTLVLVCGLQYQMAGTGKWIQVTEEEKIYNTSYVIKNLKPHTNYTVAVRCIGESHSFWSDWSSKETGLTPAAKPMKGPALWRQIINLDSQGNRKVHLLWKALNRSEANGIILGYRVQYGKRKDPTVMLQHNTTYLNYSLFLTHEAYAITVVAYNSAGDSPKATLIVPAINQTGFAAVQYVNVTSQNDQLLVQWKATRPPDNGYVIEWCLILDTSPFAGPLHWQHEDNTSEMSYLQDLEQFKRYNISVYSVYNDGPGNPFSIPAYLQQAIPEEGPAIFTPVVKGTAVTVKWDEIPVEKQRGFIINYTIFYKSAKGENAVTVNATVHEYTLKSLQKDTDYTLHVMASTEKGGINSSIFFKTDALEPEDITVIVVPILVCFLLIVNVLMICFGNKHKIDLAQPQLSCVAKFPSNSIFKFADDTTVVGQTSNNDETEYRNEIENLVNWCSNNNLSLSVNKTKEIVIDFRKCKGEHVSVYINGDEVERVESFKFLGVQITNNLFWSPHADAIVKKAHQRIYFLRRLSKFGMSATTLTNFYRCTIESILSGCVTAWYGSCSAQDRKELQKVVNVAQSITQTSLPSIDSTLPVASEKQPA